MSHSTAVQEAQDSSAVAEKSPALSLTIERSLLLKSLGHVQSVVQRRNAIPILSNVKLEAFGESISLTSTDLDVAITERLPADVAQEGALTVPAHTLYDIIRKLPDGAQVRLVGNADVGGKLDIQSGTCEFTLSCLPVNDFPVMDKGDLTHHFVLPSEKLVSLLEKTRFAISTEETRYYLNGIYLHARSENNLPTIAAVATDGHRLAKVEIAAPEGATEIPGVIIPRKTVMELKKVIDESKEDIQIALSNSKIFFQCGNAELLSKLIDGKFPDYEKVIPVGNDRVMSVNTQSLTKAIDRVSTIASEKTRAIKLSVSTGELTLAASNEENGSGHETLEVAYEASQTIDIGFNSRYLLEMMVGFQGDKVEFSFADGGSPALVRDMGDESSLFVVMPMRI